MSAMDLSDEITLEEFTTRPYQTEILNVAIERNTIVYLPTGSGKTYIAILLIKRLSADIVKSYSEGGKLTVFLVNSVPLVDQHHAVIGTHLPFEVGKYSGDMNVDFWEGEKWEQEFNKYNILVMTAQIFLDILSHGYLGLDRVNLIIFDECHQAVNDQPMRQIMQRFMNVEKSQQPRVLGLTATLLNGNCSPADVEKEVLSLETTYHSQVATIKELAQVLGFSTNPLEKVVSFTVLEDNEVILKCRQITTFLTTVLEDVKFSSEIHRPKIYSYLEAKKKESKEVKKMLINLMLHVEMFGIYGAYKAVLAYLIDIEHMKFQIEDHLFLKVMTVVTTQLTIMLKILDDAMLGYSEKDQIYKFSSPQILTTIEMLRNFKEKDNTLNGIIFVKRRFTAKVLYYVIQDLAKYDPYFSYICSDFMVGYNASARDRSSVQMLYYSKVNKKIVRKFQDGDINLLIASNVVEEGLDIPKCTLVCMFDYPNNYRSYIQSKGRARHGDSWYVMMTPVEEKAKFLKNYNTYQYIEKVLTKLLVGKNEERSLPTDDNIQSELYEDCDIEPYYVDGLNSPHIFPVAAISLLNRYCQSIGSRDRYSQLAPEWYLKKEYNEKGEIMYIVFIEMPAICPLRDIIQGPPMRTKLAAKRTAAMEVCKQLHKLGELNEHLLPQDESDVSEENSKYLFKHWPKEDETDFHTKMIPKNMQKLTTMYKLKVPSFLSGSITPNNAVYLHLIDFHPWFDSMNDKLSVFSKLMKSELGFGFITASPLPKLCNFPLYVSAGEINVSISINHNCISLSSEDLYLLKRFQNVVYLELLNILKYFMLFDDNDGGAIIIVPLRKTEDRVDIAFDIAEENDTLVKIQEPLTSEKSNIVVTDEGYLNKVVCPWYRNSEAKYVVLEVCKNKNAYTTFPTFDFNTYEEYFRSKYNIPTVNPNQPLLLVKGISRRLNCLKPRSATLKRKKNYETDQIDFDEHLIPEMCVVQKFPPELWYKASCLPSVVHRVMFLLRAEELRQSIYNKTLPVDHKWEDMYVGLDAFTTSEKKKNPVAKIPQLPSKPGASKSKAVNQDYAMKMLEKQYPWKDEQEPLDIQRNMESITMFEIKCYNQFLTADQTAAEIEQLNIVENSKFPALMFQTNYSEKPINILSLQENLGPEQWKMYQSLMSAKANDVCNYERLETLGDSFLKFGVSLFLTYKYPTFNEGRLTSWKGKIVGNKNLFYCGLAKKLGGYIKYNDFEPLSSWFPPGYRVPEMFSNKIEQNHLSANALFELQLKPNEQIMGKITKETIDNFENAMDIKMKSSDVNMAETAEIFSSMQSFFGYQLLRNKVVSDCVEALIGVYLQSSGVKWGFKMLEWFDIIPASENPTELLNQVPPSPFFNKAALTQPVENMIPNYLDLENELGYTFKNRGYLLQAITHASYSNRITDCYQRLEFLGDAVLDFLITCHLYETSANLTPGELTDLRSALVNNITFAGYVVRHRFYKHLKYMNTKLMDVIGVFVKFQEERNFAINEDTLILIEENPWYMAEHVNIPKVLGDLFESLAGAVFLDSGMNLKVVWKVFHKIMWKEIQAFSALVPKNPVKMLYEYPGASPDFRLTEVMPNGATKVSVCITCEGKKEMIHGFGDNKKEAKRAAAKLALHLLSASV